MAKIAVKPGTTSLFVRFFAQDSSKTTGAGLAGLTNSSSGLVASVSRDDDGNAAATVVSLSAGTRGTWSSGGFKEKDSTNQIGVYELGLTNASLAAGSRSCTYYLFGAANMAPVLLEIDLSNDANVVYYAGTVIGAPATAGIPDVNAKNINNVSTSSVTTINANIGETQPLNFTGTGASALVQVDTRDFLGHAVVLDGNNYPGVNLVDAAGTAVTLDSNNVLNVSTKYTGGTLQTAADVGSLATEINADVDEIITTIGVAGAGLTAITGVTLAAGQKVDVDTIKTNPVVNAGTVTFPTGATLASTTNITAGTVTNATNVTNLTNAPTAGDLTAAMKTSVQTAVDAAITANATVVEMNGDLDELVTGVIVTTNNDKMGYGLAATGLDLITIIAPSTVAATFPQMLVQLWRRFFKKTTKSTTQIKTFADDGATVVTTQTISDDGAGNQSQGAAS